MRYTTILCLLIHCYCYGETHVQKHFLYEHWKLKTLATKNTIFTHDTLAFESITEYSNDNPLNKLPSFFLESFTHHHKTRLKGISGCRKFGFYFSNDSCNVCSISVSGKWELKSVSGSLYLIFNQVEIRNEIDNRVAQKIESLTYRIYTLNESNLIILKVG